MTCDDVTSAASSATSPWSVSLQRDQATSQRWMWPFVADARDLSVLDTLLSPTKCCLGCGLMGPKEPCIGWEQGKSTFRGHTW